MALYDAHCHISTDFNGEDIDELIARVKRWAPAQFVVMSTNHLDYKYVDELATNCSNVIPSFGVHPWYSHLFTLESGGVDKKTHYCSVFGTEDVEATLLEILPEPIHFETHLRQLVALCLKHSPRVCWGELGLDKLFRVPDNGFYSNPQRPSTKLTNYRVSMSHQKRILERQLDAALQHNWPLSLHNVKAGGAVVTILRESLERNGIGHGARVCFHSYTGSIDTLKMVMKQLKPHTIFVSVSGYINLARMDEFKELCNVVPRGQLLTETDLCLNYKHPDTYEELVKVSQTVVDVRGNDEEEWSFPLNNFLS